ncbi:MAG: DUF2461 domain-containing protein, partial [Rikenellaceae bacterium]|nr:DUF2461 domain-containing protein [Rikenellaceae bacterium]
MKNVVSFLKELSAHNNRDWFEANKLRYREAQAEFNAFAERLIEGIQRFDPSTAGLTLRDCTYRIYRDVRFSPNKQPYKTHFGLYVCPGGKKSGNGGYYFHIEPCAEDGKPNYVLTSGIYMPEPRVLKSVRDEIFDNGEALLASIEKAHAEAGWELDRSNSLKRTPAGYPPGTEWDDYLKLKDFHISKTLDDAYVLAPDLAER